MPKAEPVCEFALFGSGKARLRSAIHALEDMCGRRESALCDEEDEEVVGRLRLLGLVKGASCSVVP